jgi:hypothetical protein
MLKPLKTKIIINIRRLLKYLISVIYISTYQKVIITIYIRKKTIKQNPKNTRQKNKQTRKTISSKRKEKKLVKHYNK